MCVVVSVWEKKNENKANEEIEGAKVEKIQIEKHQNIEITIWMSKNKRQKERSNKGTLEKSRI